MCTVGATSSSCLAAEVFYPRATSITPLSGTAVELLFSSSFRVCIPLMSYCSYFLYHRVLVFVLLTQQAVVNSRMLCVLSVLSTAENSSLIFLVAPECLDARHMRVAAAASLYSQQVVPGMGYSSVISIAHIFSESLPLFPISLNQSHCSIAPCSTIRMGANARRCKNMGFAPPFVRREVLYFAPVCVYTSFCSIH